MDFPEKISIHALTKRATPSSLTNTLVSADFNPRSHEESDLSKFKRKERGIVFQSTLSRRERRAVSITICICSNISIHALTKRATIDNLKTLPKKLNFNPRSHEESDVIWHKRGDRKYRFQSTLSRRERLLFNSKIDDMRKISIHALTKRATCSTRVKQKPLPKFQSTLSRRERPPLSLDNTCPS